MIRFYLKPVACLSCPENAATSRRRWESRPGEEVLVWSDILDVYKCKRIKATILF